MGRPQMHDDERRERVEELHSLGCTDIHIARLMYGRVTATWVRSVRESLKLVANYQEKTRYTGICAACNGPCKVDKPVCVACWERMSNSDRYRLCQHARCGKRTDVEQRARGYANT